METESSAPAADREPLSLTVHSMDLPDVEPGQPVQASGRWKVAALVLLCSLPVLASYWVYFFVRPQGHAAMGDLIQPVRPVPLAQGVFLDGSSHPLAELKGQWLLVTIAPAACPDSCQRRLYLQRQLRSMLGSDEDRVDWVWLISDSAPVEPKLREHLKGGSTQRVSAEVLQSWFAPAAGKGLEDYIFVVDPLGNTMMRFPAQMDLPAITKARHDLERLLRASASWDGPGR